MANSDYRFVYSDENDELVIVVPENETQTLEQLKQKQCPENFTVSTVNKESIPVDENEKNSWTFWENAIEVTFKDSEISTSD